MKTEKHIKIFLALLIAPFLSQAQTVQAGPSYFSNALFNILFVAIVMLLALIAVLGNTLQNIANSDYLAEKIKKSKQNNAGKSLGLLLLFFLAAHSAYSQNAHSTKDWTIGGLDPFTFYFMTGIILCEVAIIAVMFYIMHSLLKDEAEEKKEVIVSKVKEKTLMDVLNASVEIEKEEEIMLTHNYDGIKELDNDLPPWWKYGFYATIVFSFAYLIHFHIAKTGDLQTEEFKKEIAKGEADVAEFLKNSANNVDETNVKALSDPADLEAGKEVFMGSCVACHGKFGEGGVGPNLTDNYWLHGGSIVDVFKSVKYGWVDKGMKSWKEELSPTRIAQVSSYIKSLTGTNPANAKAPQGDAYSETGVALSDSSKTVIVQDSSKIPSSK